MDRNKYRKIKKAMQFCHGYNPGDIAFKLEELFPIAGLCITLLEIKMVVKKEIDKKVKRAVNSVDSFEISDVCAAFEELFPDICDFIKMSDIERGVNIEEISFL